jgi:hypothetical protein
MAHIAIEVTFVPLPASNPPPQCQSLTFGGAAADA